MPDPKDNVAPVDEGAEVGPVPEVEEEEDRSRPGPRPVSEGPTRAPLDRPPSP